MNLVFIFLSFQHYVNFLIKEEYKVQYHKWNEQEVQKLLLAVEQYGKRWKYIRDNFFQNISADSVRSRYNEFMKNQKRYINEYKHNKLYQQYKKQKDKTEKVSLEALPQEQQIQQLVKILQEIQSMEQQKQKQIQEQNYQNFLELFKQM